jgi:hypothetical protein
LRAACESSRTLRRPEPEAKQEDGEATKRGPGDRPAGEREVLRHLVIERRTASLERVGYEDFTSEDLSDENYITEKDVLPLR